MPVRIRHRRLVNLEEIDVANSVAQVYRSRIGSTKLFSSVYDVSDMTSSTTGTLMFFGFVALPMFRFVALPSALSRLYGNLLYR